MRKDLTYYRSLPYKLDLRRFVEEEDGLTYYCAEFQELPAVKGVHTDRLTAVKLAKELFDSYIEAHLEWGKKIPEPASPRSPKVGGRWTFRHVSGTVSDSGPSEAKVSTGEFAGPSADSQDPGVDDWRFATRGSGTPQPIEV